jgi:hypothetical protein
MLTNIGHKETESKIKQNNYESAFPSTSEVQDMMNGQTYAKQLLSMGAVFICTS